MSDLVTKKLGYKDNFKFVIMENYTNFKGLVPVVVNTGALRLYIFAYLLLFKC